MLDSTALTAVRAEPLDWRFKALPADSYGQTLDEWLRSRPSVARMGTPLMTLDEAALANNIDAMAKWCDAAGLLLAPHGKPTMAPQLWQRQLDAGAWAITVANAPQLRVARAFGVPRVIVANELVTPSAVRGLADWVAEGAEVVCFVDSVAAVNRMDDALRGGNTRVRVCVELGGLGGRAGARDIDSAKKVAAAVRMSRGLHLAGVAGYEGSLAHDASEESIERVDEFLLTLRRLHGELDYDGDTTPIVTAGGSEYFDQIAAHLAPLSSDGADVVLRAGSYVAHDDGLYSKMTPQARERTGPRLLPALRAFATVLSKPEPGKAILDAGRRDLPFDAGMPVPLDHPALTVTELNDQHCHLTGDVSVVEVGDVLRLGVSHPCTTFDKWNLLPVVDAEGTVVDAVRTFF